MVIDKALAYCRNTLKNVSRSFALTIPMLEKNIIIPVLVGYLEARILDSFEDEGDVELKKRVENIDKIVEILNNSGDTETDKKMADLTKEAVEIITNPHYLDLVQNMDKVMEVHRAMDKQDQVSLSSRLSEMAFGMKKFIGKRIDTFEQLDEYCYYVAGTVGGFLTETLLRKTKRPENIMAKKMEAGSREFGLFLQKVNIIRDFRQDILANERIFWPYTVFTEQGMKPHNALERSYEEKSMRVLGKMISNCEQHAKPVASYLHSVPEDFPGFTKAFGINFVMGLETLNRMKDNPDVFFSSPVKVTKEQKDSILKDPIAHMNRVL